MSLDRERLTAVRDLPGGGLIARCPACAEVGADTTGNHLRVYPSGAFGCVVHPGDKPHRQRIFALVGLPSDTPARLHRPPPTFRNLSADLFRR